MGTKGHAALWAWRVKERSGWKGDITTDALVSQNLALSVLLTGK